MNSLIYNNSRINKNQNSIGDRNSGKYWLYNRWTAIVSSAIALFSPKSAMQYQAGREFFRSYHAGTTTGPNQRWRPANRSGDSDIKKDNKLIIARCRDIARNNPYIKGIIRKIADNVVRNGIKPQARIRNLLKSNFISLDSNFSNSELNEQLNRELEAIWKQWARKKYIDISEYDSLPSIQKLVLSHLWIDGEVLIHRVWNKNARKKGFIPFSIEVLECDMLADYIDGDMGKGTIARRGIGFDAKTGKPIKYYILPSHPGDYQNISYRNDVVEIPASDMIHVFKRERASQTRGVSWFASIVMEMYDLGEYQYFERIGAKLAAAFGIFVKSQYPEMMSGGALGLSASESDPTLPDYIEPGRIQKLPMGTEIQIASHNRPGANFEPYIKQSLKGISAGVSTSYSTFSNDYSDSSYSADRSAKLEERLSYQGQQAFLNEKLNDNLWAWFLEGVYLAGLAEIKDFAVNSDKYTESVEWQCPGWTWVDPLKDAKAAQTDLENCITTRKKLLAQKGDDFEETMEQLLYEEQRLLEINKIKAQNLALTAPAYTQQSNNNGEQI